MGMFMYCYFRLDSIMACGVKLPNLEYNNQKAEAAFRKELVLGEDDRENYASPNIL